MKLPYMQFYVGDWLGDEAVRASSLAARGLWFDILCYMWKSPEPGYLRRSTGEPMTVEHIGRMVGESPAKVRSLLQELQANGVFDEEDGCIVNRRMARAMKLSEVRSEAGKTGAKIRHGTVLPEVLLKQNGWQNDSNGAVLPEVLPKQNAWQTPSNALTRARSRDRARARSRSESEPESESREQKAETAAAPRHAENANTESIAPRRAAPPACDHDAGEPEQPEPPVQPVNQQSRERSAGTARTSQTVPVTQALTTAALEAIRERFPECDRELAQRVAAVALQRFPPLKPDELRELIRLATRKHMKKPALYLSTVPEEIERRVTDEA